MNEVRKPSPRLLAPAKAVNGGHPRISIVNPKHHFPSCCITVIWTVLRSTLKTFAIGPSAVFIAAGFWTKPERWQSTQVHLNLAAPGNLDRTVAQLAGLTRPVVPVDFVLLAGDICDLDHGGPRAAAFLLSQLERLADKNITVYWCGGKADHPDRWPNAVELPDNVVVFANSSVEKVTHERGAKTIATIVGAGQVVPVDLNKPRQSTHIC